MKVVIQSTTGHTVYALESLGHMPAPGDFLRFAYNGATVIGIVERRQFDFTSNTVTLTGHWMKEAK